MTPETTLRIAIIVNRMCLVLSPLILLLLLRASCVGEEAEKPWTEKEEQLSAHGVLCWATEDLLTGLCKGHETFPWPSELKGRPQSIKLGANGSLEDSGLAILALEYFFSLIYFLLRTFRWMCCFLLN